MQFSHLRDTFDRGREGREIHAEQRVEPLCLTIHISRSGYEQKTLSNDKKTATAWQETVTFPNSIATFTGIAKKIKKTLKR